MTCSSRYRYLRPRCSQSCWPMTLFLRPRSARPTRFAYAEAILEVGERNPEVVVLNADVSMSMGTNRFPRRFPERTFNFGIAEQNMMAAAAGMATTGPDPLCLDLCRLCHHARPRPGAQLHLLPLPERQDRRQPRRASRPPPTASATRRRKTCRIMRALANMTVIAAADSPTAEQAVHAAAPASARSTSALPATRCRSSTRTTIPSRSAAPSSCARARTPRSSPTATWWPRR